MTPRNITVDDFLKLALVSDPQIAPDGERVACVKRVIDADKNRYRGEIWVTPVQDGEPRRYTGPDSSNSSPRWSPDGKQIAFLSDRQKPKGQIYLLPSDGGEAWALTNLEVEGSLSGLRWSPDGAYIAFLFRATPEPYRKEQVEERKKKELSSPIRHHTRLFYRLDGAGYFDNEYPQVWAADVWTGECRQLTDGQYRCQEPVWSPDSRTLAFLSDRRDDTDITGSDDTIYTVPVGGGEPIAIPTPPGPKHALSWSPDGSRFAYVGNPDLDDPWGTNNQRLMLIDSSGSDTALDLTGAFDLSVGYDTLADAHEIGAGDMIQWSPDGLVILVPVSTFGDTRLCGIRTDGIGGPVMVSPSGGEMGSYSTGQDGFTIVFGTPTAPAEIFVASFPSSDSTSDSDVEIDEPVWHQRTHFNAAMLAEVQVVTPEEIVVENGEGGTVHGWLLKPADFNPEERYPLVLYVHGGPHTQYGNVFLHEFQSMAAQGYVVLYANPRGSKGYGEAHTKAIKGAWGGADFRDLMTVVDYAAGLDYVDPQRMAIMGGSYGGFMTAWTIGHTDRFRCAIADRLVGNLHSMSGTCDFPWRHGSYFKGNSWDDPAHLWRCSPLAYAGNIVTPLLIIHSDGDLRCPAGQAEELFTALRLQRKTVEYVRYPAEASHGLSRNGPPDLRLDRLKRNLDWLDRWLKS